MSSSISDLLAYIKQGHFTQLFLEELGWDQLERRLSIAVGDQKFALSGVAQKLGVEVFLCPMRCTPRVRGCFVSC